MNRKFVVIHAMAEEQAPFYPLSEKDNVLEKQGLSFRALDISTQLGGYSVVSGIGLVNAARAATIAASLPGIELIIYCGTAGSTNNSCGVGEVVIGSSFRYHNADATMFDYQMGQVPGMPAKYEAAPALLASFFANDTSLYQQLREENPHLDSAGVNSTAQTYALTIPDSEDKIKVRSGEILSGDSFITAANITEIKQHFPQAIATDMESVAAAQVCYLAEIPYGAIRCISDLCSPDSEQVFHLNLSQASTNAVKVCRVLLERYFSVLNPPAALG